MQKTKEDLLKMPILKGINKKCVARRIYEYEPEFKNRQGGELLYDPNVGMWYLRQPFEGRR